jgi:predicted aldo/keto reductase-like oxidoreductase
MQYRTLGRTGLNVSQLGFGCMRLPMVGEGDAARVDREQSTPMIRRAIDAGVNYIDSAVFYCNHDSQRAVGDALRDGYREKVVVSTKNNYYGDDEAAWWENLENSLERLQVQHIDVYNQHGMNWERYNSQHVPYMSKWMTKAQDQGLIGHICCSFHDGPEGLINLVKTEEFSAITLQYNLLNRELEEGIALAAEKNIGVVVMGPVAGGRLGEPSEVLEQMVPGVPRVPELALKFVLSNPNVTVALSGMTKMSDVVENLDATADFSTLTDQEMALIEQKMKDLAKMSELYCTGCGYCMPCPEEVNISGTFDKFNRGNVYGLWDAAKRAYAQQGTVAWDAGKKADACTECGACEDKCPQNIAIRQQLADAHSTLTT